MIRIRLMICHTTASTVFALAKAMYKFGWNVEHEAWIGMRKESLTVQGLMIIEHA